MSRKPHSTLLTPSHKNVECFSCWASLRRSDLGVQLPTYTRENNDIALPPSRTRLRAVFHLFRRPPRALGHAAVALAIDLQQPLAEVFGGRVALRVGRERDGQPAAVVQGLLDCKEIV